MWGIEYASPAWRADPLTPGHLTAPPPHPPRHTHQHAGIHPDKRTHAPHSSDYTQAEIYILCVKYLNAGMCFLGTHTKKYKRFKNLKLSFPPAVLSVALYFQAWLMSSRKYEPSLPWLWLLWLKRPRPMVLNLLTVSSNLSGRVFVNTEERYVLPVSFSKPADFPGETSCTDDIAMYTLFTQNILMLWGRLLVLLGASLNWTVASFSDSYATGLNPHLMFLNHPVHK